MYYFKERKCPICGSNNRKKIGRRGGAAHHRGFGIELEIVRCSICGHIYPFPFPFARNVSELYGDPTKYFAGHDPLEKKRLRAGVVIELERLLGSSGRLLDVGSGCGELLAAAKERGWTAIGVETAKRFCEYSRSTYGVEVINSKLTDDLFPSSSFEAVTLAAVLEHVEDPMALLHAVALVLTPGGLLFIDVPNEGSLACSLVNAYFRFRGRDWVIQLSPTFPPYHIQGFSKKSLAFALDHAGFDIVALRTYSIGLQGFQHESLLQLMETVVWRAVDCICSKLKQGTGILLYARRR